jgi:hypothetical protein
MFSPRLPNPKDVAMSIRVVFAVAIVSSLALGRAAAQQAQPADTEQKLKALDNKIDLAIKLLEGKAPRPANRADLEKQLQLMTEARNAVADKFENANKEYVEFRSRSPYPLAGKAKLDDAAQRLSKDRTALLDVLHRRSEVTARTGLVKDVDNNEFQARALLVLLQRRGVDTDQLRRMAGEKAGPLDQVRLYAESLSQESRELQSLAEAAGDRLNEDEKLVRDVALHDVIEENLRNKRDAAKRIYEAIANQIDKLEAVMEMDKRKP